jgi:hypothetical protein
MTQRQNQPGRPGQPGRQDLPEQKDPQKKRALELESDDLDDEDREPEADGARQYESGRNPDMQQQRSNRQGSQQPTQQRKEDR